MRHLRQDEQGIEERMEAAADAVTEQDLIEYFAFLDQVQDMGAVEMGGAF